MHRRGRFESRAKFLRRLDPRLCHAVSCIFPLTHESETCTLALGDKAETDERAAHGVLDRALSHNRRDGACRPVSHKVLKGTCTKVREDGHV